MQARVTPPLPPSLPLLHLVLLHLISSAHVFCTHVQLCTRVLNPRTYCREHMLQYDEGSGGSAGLVLRKLKALHALPMELEMELVQGLAKCLAITCSSCWSSH